MHLKCYTAKIEGVLSLVISSIRYPDMISRIQTRCICRP